MGNDREKFRFGVTEPGKAVLRGTLYVTLAALIVPAFGVLSALICVLLVTLLVGLAARPRVPVDGHLPERIVAGRATRLTYTLQNLGRWPAYGLSTGFASLPKAIELVEDEPVISRLGPGESTEASLLIRPARRGRYRIDHPVCRSSFPFNLFWFGASRSGQETLTVLPPFWRLNMSIHRLGRHVHSSGSRLANRVGVCPEYVGSRPFVAGDSPRRIDARAWARLAAPATKEYDEDCDNYAAIVLDTSAPVSSKSHEIKEFEAAVSICASAAFTINDDCFIDLLLAGGELHEFTGQPRAARLDRIHELLAEVEPSQTDFTEQAILALADRFREMSQVVFVFLRWDAMRERIVEMAEWAGCHCTVVLIGEPGRIGGRAGWIPRAKEEGVRCTPYLTRAEGILPLSSDVTAGRTSAKQGQSPPRACRGDGLATQGRDALATSVRVLSADEVLSGEVRSL